MTNIHWKFTCWIDFFFGSLKFNVCTRSVNDFFFVNSNLFTEDFHKYGDWSYQILKFFFLRNTQNKDYFVRLGGRLYWWFKRTKQKFTYFHITLWLIWTWWFWRQNRTPECVSSENDLDSDFELHFVTHTDHVGDRNNDRTSQRNVQTIHHINYIQ